MNPVAVDRPVTDIADSATSIQNQVSEVEEQAAISVTEYDPEVQAGDAPSSHIEKLKKFVKHQQDIRKKDMGKICTAQS